MLPCAWISLKAAFWIKRTIMDFINYLTLDCFPGLILPLQWGILRQEAEMASSMQFLFLNRAMNTFLSIRR